MPKKKLQEAQAEQSARFRAEVERLIDAGELNLTEADDRFKRLVTQSNLKIRQDPE
jgi:uncharacterized protein YaiL (DUF2058 family)